MWTVFSGGGTARLALAILFAQNRAVSKAQSCALLGGVFIAHQNCPADTASPA
jgi:hypothetical protein